MILINMEMPEKCGLCPLFHAEHPMHCQGVKADRKKKIVAPYGQPRPDWCPLHEVDDMPTVFQTMNQQEHKSLVEWKEDFKGFVECLDIPRDDYKGIMAYIDEVPSAERTKITYQEISEVLLLLWMDGIFGDGDYHKLMDMVNKTYLP